MKGGERRATKELADGRGEARGWRVSGPAASTHPPKDWSAVAHLGRRRSRGPHQLTLQHPQLLRQFRPALGHAREEDAVDLRLVICQLGQSTHGPAVPVFTVATSYCCHLPVVDGLILHVLDVQSDAEAWHAWHFRGGCRVRGRVPQGSHAQQAIVSRVPRGGPEVAQLGRAHGAEHDQPVAAWRCWSCCSAFPCARGWATVVHVVVQQQRVQVRSCRVRRQ
jgi:hypothetical protein